MAEEKSPYNGVASISSPGGSTRTARLADTIRQRIVSERLADGDLFMTEGQLAEEYGVSRSVTRDAVSQLRELGILEGRKRKGLVVRRPDPVRLLSRSLPALAMSEQDVGELATLRYVLEVGAIELAVRNGTDEQITKLKNLAADFERAVKEGEGQVRENQLEVAFHGLILEMTGSTLIRGMQQSIAHFFVTYYSNDSNLKTEEKVIWQHYEIATAIESRDVERARAMIRLHFERVLPKGLTNNEGERGVDAR